MLVLEDLEDLAEGNHLERVADLAADFEEAALRGPLLDLRKAAWAISSSLEDSR